MKAFQSRFARRSVIKHKQLNVSEKRRSSVSNVYSPSRPLHASNSTQTKMHEEVAEYAYSQDVQDLLQKMCADLFTERPIDAIHYMVNWLSAEKQRREEKEADAAAAK
ncbi:hypothetical protein COO60DRAFT_924175 [Scenedesmus sp. NREL 46B-D3]|nr:hypothetical protein COO60DRAFT_924175 [Scenedesmus sp. NREL 46B-D3]